jgi:glutathione peroxidase
VTFPVTTKIEVNGPGADPMWVYLREAAPGDLGPDAGVLYEHLEASRREVIGTDEVKWNFTKFLVDADGAVVRRYEPHETPETPEQVGADLAGR